MTEQPTFCDIALNLTDHMFMGHYNGRRRHEADLINVLQNAIQSGVDKILATGVNPKCMRETAKIIRAVDPERKHLFMTAGVHPTESKVFGKAAATSGAVIDDIRKFIQENSDIVRAYGEFGLDRARTNFCDFETQVAHFPEQLALASTLDLPLFLHCRAAADIFYDYLRQYPDALKQGGVVHSFDGTVEELEQVLDAGLDIGINGCSMKTKTTFDAIVACPADRLHFETDAPWCIIKATHDSFPLVKWTAVDQDKFVKYQKHQPASTGLTVLQPKSDTVQDYVYVKGRNEPALVPQVAESVFRIKHPNCDEYTKFSEFARQVYNRSTTLFKMI